MRRLVALLLFLAVSLSAMASERAVITTRFSGTTLRDHQLFTFLPGEVVTVRQRGEKQSLAESYSRDWATTGGVWVPNEIFVYPKQFEKIKAWAGERKIETGGGDFEATYRVASSGAFIAEFGDGHEVIKRRGHLYRFKSVVWAKIEGKWGPQPGQADTFVLMPNGSLCWPYEVCTPAP
jgi:hypothetical protein